MTIVIGSIDMIMAVITIVIIVIVAIVMITTIEDVAIVTINMKEIIIMIPTFCFYHLQFRDTQFHGHRTMKQHFKDNT